MQSPEPDAHDKVLDNNPDRIGIWKCWVLRRGENWSTRRKTSRSKDENQQQTQPAYDAKMPYLVSLVPCQSLCGIFWPFQGNSSGF